MAHCPRCGRELAVHATGRLRCAAGEMLLSQQLTDEIGRFTSGETIESAAITFPVGGDWHCLADGALLDEKDGRMYCARCARYLPARIWYQVVEYHGHR